MDININISGKQKQFIDSIAYETLFGGAAGGGKSYGQLIDALLYALQYPKSKQLILRRTFSDLNKSLIRVSMELYKKEIYTYNDSKHTGTFTNGSIIDFGYCDSEKDVYQYQSAEYDVIRFDELTHFTEFQYIYLLSRCRGANKFPKSVKSSTNPGGIGHEWVKKRFIDICPPCELYTDAITKTTRIFIPSLVTDNKFLLESDADYLNRLENLPEKEKKALRYGEWDIFEGQYFTEFNRDIHVIKPFEIPVEWRYYYVCDYGLDMLSVYVIAVDTQGRAYVISEIYESNLIVSQAAEKIKAQCNSFKIYDYICPPDLKKRTNDSGKSVVELFYDNGINFIICGNSRVAGWLNLHEWLQPFKDETGKITANLVIFENCTNLIRCLPALQVDSKNPMDCANEPHELTHAPDAIRYFLDNRPVPAKIKPQKTELQSYKESLFKPKHKRRGF